MAEVEKNFGESSLELLTAEEICKHTRLVYRRHKHKLRPDESFELDRIENMGILVTGMPRWGKSTVLNQIESAQAYPIAVHVQPDESQARKPDNLKRDDFDAMIYNLGFAAVGIAKLITNSQVDRLITLYERGLIDQFVFAEALNAQYGNLPSYKRDIQAFKGYCRIFASLIHGIIVCNSSAETAISNGSHTDKDILEKLSLGFQRFPTSLSRILRAGRIDPRIVISLDFETPDKSQSQLKRAINTLVHWNLVGQVSTDTS